MNAVEDDLSSDMQFVALKRLYYGLELQREHRHFSGGSRREKKAVRL
jgi:hypothetical protein